jgi:ubiquinone/menaquinone biosynthesis C-methylase UbiE
MELTEAQERARATWSAGDYDGIVDYIWSVGGDLVGRVGVQEGEKVLDVACGTGNATIPAAQAGGVATGLDITPELFGAARRRAAQAGVEIELVEGDAEALPFDDGGFEVVLSTFGCMFAPDHAKAAVEIARVVKPGGRIGVAAWTPDGGIGRFFAHLADFTPPPPEGFQPPTLWGDRDHVTQLFEGTGVELRFEESAVDFRFESIDQVFGEYVAKFGPLVMLRQALEAEGRWDEAKESIRGYYAQENQATDGTVHFRGEYLIALGSKAG